jgi:ABC-type Fe3+ transport system permease subunit
MIMPAVISGWLLAFTLSLDDLVIASFVSGPGATTLPMLVFSSVRMGVNPEINALATLILGVVGIVGFIAWYLMARAEKQRVRDIQRARRLKHYGLQVSASHCAAPFSWKTLRWDCLQKRVHLMLVLTSLRWCRWRRSPLF